MLVSKLETSVFEYIQLSASVEKQIGIIHIYKIPVPIYIYIGNSTVPAAFSGRL